MGITHKNFLLKVFGFSVPCLCCHFSFPSLSSALSSSCHHHLLTATHTHTHTHTHAHTLQHSRNLILGFLCLVQDRIEESETDTNPHSAFSPNIRTMCPRTSVVVIVAV